MRFYLYAIATYHKSYIYNGSIHLYCYCFDNIFKHRLKGCVPGKMRQKVIPGYHVRRNRTTSHTIKYFDKLSVSIVLLNDFRSAACIIKNRN
jgi:hypothetical protein